MPPTDEQRSKLDNLIRALQARAKEEGISVEESEGTHLVWRNMSTGTILRRVPIARYLALIDTS